jgi:hypothetical protein
MTNKRILLVLVLTVLAVGIGAATRGQLTGRGAQPAFTLISRVTHFSPSDTSQQLHGEETRYVFSDGSYRVVFDGEPDTKGVAPHREYFFKYGAGFFEVDFKKKQLVRDARMSQNARGHAPATAEALRSDPQFIRTETLFGMTAYVMRITNEQTGLPTTDLYFAVETGANNPLKEIDYGRNGRVVTIVEPLSIVFGEPNSSLRNGPDYPVVEDKTKQ